MGIATQSGRNTLKACKAWRVGGPGLGMGVGDRVGVRGMSRKGKMGKEKEKMELMKTPVHRGTCAEVRSTCTHAALAVLERVPCSRPSKTGKGEVLFAANLGGTRYLHHLIAVVPQSLVPCTGGGLWRRILGSDTCTLGEIKLPPLKAQHSQGGQDKRQVFCQHIGPSSPPKANTGKDVGAWAGGCLSEFLLKFQARSR